MNMPTPNQPYSGHWADVTAFRVVQKKLQSHCNHTDNLSITVASGITPSGTVHIGNFREVVTAYFVTLALKKLGVKVRFIYSWDNLDTFRKVPANLDPSKIESFQTYLRMPICDIPDPWNFAESYAEGRMDLFEKELAACGITCEFIRQSTMYRSGTYNTLIRQVLDHKDEIKNILNEHRRIPLADDWTPVICYCPACSKDTTTITHHGDKISIECQSCGHKSNQTLTNNPCIKLVWRVDWPMRWCYEQVDFEPGGKDHSSQGGSFETASQISETVFNRKAPEYLGYDFVMVKNMSTKMSSSAGNVVSLGDCLDVYEPEMIHFLFASQRPNHDFSFGLDRDVIRIYEEYDAAISTILAPAAASSPKKQKRRQQLHRICELAHHHLGITDIHHSKSQKILTEIASLPPFRELCHQLQVMDHNISATLSRFYPHVSQAVSQRISQRIHKAHHWLKTYADREFVITVNSQPAQTSWSPEEADLLAAMRELAQHYEFADLDPKLIHKLIYEEVIHRQKADPKTAFRVIYQTLISKDQGPKLGDFLHQLGSQRVLACLPDH